MLTCLTQIINEFWFGLTNIDTFIICIGFGLMNVDTILTLIRHEYDPTHEMSPLIIMTAYAHHIIYSHH